MQTLLLSVLLAAPPEGQSEWKFVDEATLAGRSVLTYRTVELADTPTRPLHADDKPPIGSKFGSIGVGQGGRQRLDIVWHSGTSTLWFDANGDGRFAAEERHTLGDKTLEAKIDIAFGEGGKQQRTVLIRKRNDGIAWAIRGYTTGKVTIGGKVVLAALTDGDADGCFDGAGKDRIWLDLDGDGKFDPLTEQFPLGTAITADGTALLVQPRPDGLGVQVRERPKENGALRVQVPQVAKAEVVELTAHYISEFGELIVVKETDKSQSLPAGKYRVDSVQLALADIDGKVWRYSFYSSSREYGIKVEKGKETVHQLLSDPKVEVSFDAKGGVRAGEVVMVQADILAGGLYLSRCEVTSKNLSYEREVFAEIKLTEPGSLVLDQCKSEFH
jgi:hypothetical protein